MASLNDYVDLYKEQLDKGNIQKAYTGLVKYVMRLGTTLTKNLAEKYEVGHLFPGYMDYTYFYYTNEYLKKRKLKLGLVLNHEKIQFEIWLLGQTIQVQEMYWEYFKKTKWNKDRTTKPQYAILETAIITRPDFDDLEKLTKMIEEKVLTISEEILEDVKKAN